MRGGMSPIDLIMLLALAVVFTPLERLHPIRSGGLDRPGLWTDALHIFVGGNLIRWGAGAALAAVALGVQSVIPQALGQHVRAQPGWLQFAELLLLSDFAFYWAHRLFHAVPALWRFHEVHHSSHKLDWVAGHRVHPVDQIINGTLMAAPAVALGFPPSIILAYAVLYRWHATFLHSNVRADFGPLKWLVASPHYHHWHHADQADAYDKNFGGQLVIFDWLFGTLNLPSGMPERYGIGAPIAPDYVGQLIHPFRKARWEAQPVAKSSGEPAV